MVGVRFETFLSVHKSFHFRSEKKEGRGGEQLFRVIGPLTNTLRLDRRRLDTRQEERRRRGRDQGNR